MKRGHLGSEAVQGRLRSADKIRRAEADTDLAGLLENAAFRRFLLRLVDGRCEVFGGSFVPDPLQTAFAEGRRSVGIGLMQDAQRVAPERWTLALGEEIAARADDARARTAATTEESTDE